LERYGVTGRCEAVSDWMYGKRGQQCAHHAIYVRDGRRVCGLHLRATRPHFIGSAEADPYQIIAETISRLVKIDERLHNAVAIGMGLEQSPYKRFKSSGRRGSTPIDLTGKRFGSLVAVQISNRRNMARHAFWHCRCDCGNTKEIRGDALTNGYHLSCGCHRRAASKQRTKTLLRGTDGTFLNAAEAQSSNWLQPIKL
jgi:hypothetical protein